MVTLRNWSFFVLFFYFFIDITLPLLNFVHFSWQLTHIELKTLQQQLSVLAEINNIISIDSPENHGFSEFHFNVHFLYKLELMHKLSVTIPQIFSVPSTWKWAWSKVKKTFGLLNKLLHSESLQVILQI